MCATLLHHQNVTSKDKITYFFEGRKITRNQINQSIKLINQFNNLTQTYLIYGNLQVIYSTTITTPTTNNYNKKKKIK